MGKALVEQCESTIGMAFEKYLRSLPDVSEGVSFDPRLPSHGNVSHLSGRHLLGIRHAR